MKIVLLSIMLAIQRFDLVTNVMKSKWKFRNELVSEIVWKSFFIHQKWQKNETEMNKTHPTLNFAAVW